MGSRRSASRASVSDFYELLEVRPDARVEVINAAYRELMRIHHPDRGGNEALAKAMNEAHSVLSNQASRAEYDNNRGNKKRGLVPGGVVGNYKIVKLIAEGGCGKTYRAEHILLKEPVCIKDCSNLSKDDAWVLIEEAKTLWDLRHYSIPALRDILELDDGTIAIVMSYIPGPTLEEIVKKVGRLDPEHVAWITERIINALQYLHFHGVVHGDLKPQNIIVQPASHQATLVDFGLAVMKPDPGSSSKGYTEFFSPPEEMSAASPLLPESDFYSLGMVMIYALSGKVECVKRKEIPSDVPDALGAFVRKLIVRDVLQRPNWQKEDLFEVFQDVRKEAFGRSRSKMKPIPGF